CLAYNKTLYFSIESESRLLSDLFREYDKRVRPVQKPSDTVHVSFGLGLKALLYV
ncbi:nicotinic acetylcholine receptor subunit type H, partial [Biomphalaria glabrata]